MICRRTVSPIARTSITDLPSSLVFNSMLPGSFMVWKMTEAFSMGLPVESRTMVTSMREVGGGDLYLRPRLLLSWALALVDTIANANAAMITAKRKKGRRDMEFILPRGVAHKRF